MFVKYEKIILLILALLIFFVDSSNLIAPSNKFEDYLQSQKLICEHLNITPSDTFLLATSTDDEWKRFKRENGINRICLTQAYGLL